MSFCNCLQRSTIQFLQTKSFGRCLLGYIAKCATFNLHPKEQTKREKKAWAELVHTNNDTKENELSPICMKVCKTGSKVEKIVCE